MQIFALIYLSFQLFFLLKKKIKRNNGVFLITVLKTSTPICHLKQRQVALLGKGKNSLFQTITEGPMSVVQTPRAT